MSKIKKPSEVETKTTVAIGIYGQPGIGKTTLGLSAPKPLLIDIDNGSYRVQAEHRTDSVQVKSYQDVLDVLDEDLSTYETIVIDTLGKMVDLMGEHIGKDFPKLIQADGTLSVKAWGIIKNDFKALNSKIAKLKKNVVFISHEREEKDGDNKVLRPDVSGSAAKDMIKDLDALGYMEMLGKKRSICFSPSNKFYAKNSLKLDDYIEVDNLSKADNTFLTNNIIKPAIQKRMSEFLDQEEYQKVITEAEKIISEHGKGDEARELLRKLPKIGNSQYRIKAMLESIPTTEGNNEQAA